MIPANVKESAAAILAPPSLAAIGWMLVLMLPLAAFFSALCMALAIFARSTKEGQYYLMPLFLVVTPLVFVTLAPGVELDAFYSLVPVTNVALLLKTLMLNQYDTAMLYFLPVLAPTLLYAIWLFGTPPSNSIARMSSSAKPSDSTSLTSSARRSSIKNQGSPSAWPGVSSSST